MCATTTLFLRVCRTAISVDVMAWRRPAVDSNLYAHRIPRLWCRQITAPRSATAGFVAPRDAHASDTGIAVVFGNIDVRVYRFSSYDAYSMRGDVWAPTHICSLGSNDVHIACGTVRRAWRWRPMWCRLSDPDLLVACEGGALALFDAFTGTCTSRLLLHPAIDLNVASCSFDATRRCVLVADNFSSALLMFPLDDGADEVDGSVSVEFNLPRVRHIHATRVVPAWRAVLHDGFQHRDLVGAVPLLWSSSEALPPMCSRAPPDASQFGALYPNDRAPLGREVLVLRRAAGAAAHIDCYDMQIDDGATGATDVTTFCCALDSSEVVTWDRGAFCAAGTLIFSTDDSRPHHGLIVAGRDRRELHPAGVSRKRQSVSAAPVGHVERRYVALHGSHLLAASSPWASPVVRLIPDDPGTAGPTRTGVVVVTQSDGVFYVVAGREAPS